MTTLTTTYSKHIRKTRAAYKTYSRPSYIERFRHFIEHSDWDERILKHEERANRVCIGVMVAAVLYFVPLIIKHIL